MARKPTPEDGVPIESTLSGGAKGLSSKRASGLWAPIAIGAYLGFHVILMPEDPALSRNPFIWWSFGIFLMLLYSFTQVEPAVLGYARMASVLGFIGGAVLAIEASL